MALMQKPDFAEKNIGLYIVRQRLAVIFGQLWFVVERVHLAESSLKENLDGTFGFGGIVGQDQAGSFGRRSFLERRFTSQERRQSNAAQTRGKSGQKISPVQRNPRIEARTIWITHFQISAQSINTNSLLLNITRQN